MRTPTLRTPILMLAFVTGLVSQAAWPADEAFCNRYARHALEQFEIARDENCPGLNYPVWSMDFDHHYKWCRSVSEAQANQGETQRLSVLRECRDKRGQVSGDWQQFDPAAAQSRMQRCNDYATRAVQQQQANRDRGCGLSGPQWNPDFQAHYEWCLAGENLRFAEGEQQRRQQALARCGNGAGIIREVLPATPLPIPEPRTPAASPLPIPEPSTPGATPLPIPEPRTPEVSPLPIPEPSTPGATPLPIPEPRTPDATPLPIPEPRTPDATPLPIPEPRTPAATPLPIPKPDAGQVRALTAPVSRSVVLQALLADPAVLARLQALPNPGGMDLQRLAWQTIGGARIAGDGLPVGGAKRSGNRFAPAGSASSPDQFDWERGFFFTPFSMAPVLFDKGAERPLARLSMPQAWDGQVSFARMARDDFIYLFNSDKQPMAMVALDIEMPARAATYLVTFRFTDWSGQTSVGKIQQLMRSGLSAWRYQGMRTGAMPLHLTPLPDGRGAAAIFTIDPAQLRNQRWPAGMRRAGNTNTRIWLSGRPGLGLLLGGVSIRRL